MRCQRAIYNTPSIFRATRGTCLGWTCLSFRLQEAFRWARLVQVPPQRSSLDCSIHANVRGSSTCKFQSSCRMLRTCWVTFQRMRPSSMRGLFRPSCLKETSTKRGGSSASACSCVAVIHPRTALGRVPVCTVVPIPYNFLTASHHQQTDAGA